MRILVVDHNAVDPLAQSLYRRISGAEDTAVRVLVPNRWFDNYRMVKGTPVPASGGFEVVPLPVLFPTRTHRLVYGGVGNQIREFQPDLLYVNAEPENFQTLECALMSRRYPRVRFVFSTWRNIDHPAGDFPYHLSSVHSFAERFVLRRADHAVAFVPEAPAIFSRRGFNRITWIPPEVDTSVFTPSVRGKSDSVNTFTVGYAGRLHPLKGVDLILDALAGLPPEFHLLIVGGGAEEAALRARSTSLGLDDRVIWRAPVARMRMPEVLHEMDVLVLPSRTGGHWKEQFGRVLVEAMACGVPVIGSDSGSIPSVIGESGQVVHEGDVPGLQDALIRLRNDPQLRRQCVLSGLARVSEKYSVPVVAGRMGRLMRSVAEGTAPSLDI